jgi:hypothetical protein
MNTASGFSDPVDPRQRRHARILGLAVVAGFLILVAICFTMFSLKGLPKDPKEWKRLQERRSAAEAEKAAQATEPVVAPAPTSEPKSEKDSTR